jgi:hypothetical protein
MTTELPTVEQMMQPFVERLREMGVDGDITIKADFSTEYTPHFTLFVGEELITAPGCPFPQWDDIERLVSRHLIVAANSIDLVALGM